MGVVIIYDRGGGRRENGGLTGKTSCVGWSSIKLFNSGGGVKKLLFKH